MSTVSRAEWGARPPNGGPGTLSPMNVKGLAFHWPAMSKPIRGIKNVSAALRGWQNFHMDDRGWSDIAYQVAVDQDGNRYELRGLRTQSGANGDEDVNRAYGAVLLALAPGEVPSMAMIQTVREVVTDHRALFPGSHLLVGHGDVRKGGTTCPGPLVTAALRAGTFEPVVIPPPPTVKPKLTRGPLVDGALWRLRRSRDKAIAAGKEIRAGHIKAAIKELRKTEQRES